MPALLTLKLEAVMARVPTLLMEMAPLVAVARVRLPLVLVQLDAPPDCTPN